MSRIIATTAAAALMATPAFAAPGFGASGLSAASEGAEARAQEGGPSLVDLLLSFYNIKLETPSSGRAAEPVRETEGEAYACKDSKKDESEEASTSKKQKTTGPEPVYLAF